MRSMFLAILLLIGLAFCGVSYALQAASPQGGIPDNWYSEVKYVDTTEPGKTAEHGNALVWDQTAHDGYSVRKANEADAEATAGIVPVDADTAHNLDGLGRPLKNGDVFLMQIWGYAKDVPTDGNAVAGQAIGTESSALAAGGFVGDGDGLGVALETDGADTSSPTGFSGDVYIRAIGDTD